jgi:DNA processing protein
MSIFPQVTDAYGETIAYECLYSEPGADLESVCAVTSARNLRPTEALSERLLPPQAETQVKECIDLRLGTFGVAVEGTPQYPSALQSAARRAPLLYYRGDVTLALAPSVAIVGSRKASAAGLRRAEEFARVVVKTGRCVASGLAAGVDTAALKAAIGAGGKVVAVIGTPLDECYPRGNEALQSEIAREHLLVSQVPFYRYSVQPFDSKKQYFKERDVTMAAISQATVIAEASDASGTLVQARACVEQERPLFIARACLEDPGLAWPARFVAAGAYVVDSVQDLARQLEETAT